MGTCSPHPQWKFLCFIGNVCRLGAWAVEYVGLCAYGGRTAGHAGTRAEKLTLLLSHTCTHSLVYTPQQSNNDPVLTQQPKTEREQDSQWQESLQGGWWGWRMGDRSNCRPWMTELERWMEARMGRGAVQECSGCRETPGGLVGKGNGAMDGGRE